MIGQSLHPLIRTNINLADKTWFGTGGDARFFAEPTTAEEFQTILVWAREQQLPLFMLGKGANILISDAGFNGLVVRPALRYINQEPSGEQVFVTAGAGVSMPDLIDYCLANNIIGLEEFSGIPGTVGGSVYINLHYFEFLLEQFLHNARVINKKMSTIEIVDRAWFNFGYDQSRLFDQNYFLVDATFILKKCTELEAAYARGRSVEIIRHRMRRYPTAGTCGSFFRNFHEDEVSLTVNGKKMIYVAYYLDKLGVKGALSVGNAIVSYQHANMLVNKGSATSTDIINLARKMQEMVRDTFGIIPQPECQLIGFEKYPLL